MFFGLSCIELMWGFLIRLKTWPPLLKIEHRGQTVVFHIYLQLNSDIGKSVQHDEIYLCSNFGFKLFSHVGDIALFQLFLLFLMLFLSKIFSPDIIWSIGTQLGMNVSCFILHRNDVGIFYLSKNLAAITKNRTYSVGVRQ